MKDSGKLLLTEEEWAARRNSRKASSSRGGDGKRRGKASSEKKKKVDPNVCRCCRKTDHWAKECSNPTFCALHDVEAKEKGDVMVLKGPEKALKAINLDKPHAPVHLGHVGSGQVQRWYLDSGASNHMMGSKAAFSELDDDMTGTVKFDDGSRVAIRGHVTSGARTLRSCIISISQLDERGSEVLIKDGVLRIRDQEQRLLAKVKRSRNQLYLLDLKVEQPVCLVMWHIEEPWL
ncbi:uncharacterized protein [Miscanthus floridulus]|uniref:uncharacterized protein n=1 Tax=Miscanthus floridulus TaxID=154761 RepID=UPI00345B2EC6